MTVQGSFLCPVERSMEVYYTMKVFNLTFLLMDFGGSQKYLQCFNLSSHVATDNNIEITCQEWQTEGKK